MLPQDSYSIESEIQALKSRLAALEERLPEEDDSEESPDRLMLDPSVYFGAHDLSSGLDQVRRLEEEYVEIVLPAAVKEYLENPDEGEAFIEFFGDHFNFDMQSYEQFVEYYRENPDRITFYDVPDEAEEIFESESVRKIIREHLDVPKDVQDELNGWNDVVETLAQELAFMQERGTVVARKPRAFNVLVNVVDASVSVGVKAFDRFAGAPLKKRGPLSNRERFQGIGKWTGTIVSAGEVLPLLGVPMIPGVPTALSVILMTDP